MTYEIFEENMERLTKKLNTIQNKCQKYGCEFTFEELGYTFREIKGADGVSRTYRFVTVDVSGTAKVNNWEFVGTIEHASPTNIVRTFREYPIPDRFYTAECFCEHCKTKRTRKDTYIVRNTVTNEYKQVGKTCLKDFTNGLSAEAVASYISWFDELIKGEAPDLSSSKCFYGVEEVLTYALEAVRMYGYSKSDSVNGGTVQIVREQMKHYGDYQDRIRDGFFEGRAEHKAKAALILNWVDALEDQFGYISNLKAACGGGYCEWRDLGLVCSAVAAYNREMGKMERKIAEKNQPSSEWFGSEGDRVELRELKLTLLTGWETQFGYTYLYKLVATDGTVFTWKTGTWLSDTEDLPEVISLKGTIKAHTEFRGVKQTELTRCKVL